MELHDSNGDGEITREELLAAGDEFKHGLEETRLSNIVSGHLIS